MMRDMSYYVTISGDRICENCNRVKALTNVLIQEYIQYERNSGKKDLFIVASGSSYNAALTAKPFMERYTDIRVMVITPHEYNNFLIDSMRDSFFVFVSQSGCSTNIIRAIESCKRTQGKIILLTGNENSKAAELSDIVIEYGVGNESVDYVTLGFSTLVEFFCLFALEKASYSFLLEEGRYLELLDDIRKTGQVVAKTYESVFRWIEQNEKNFLEMDKAILVGDGANMGTIREIALKFQETLKIPTMYYESEEYLHGPNMQLTPEYTVFFVESGQDTLDLKKIYDATRCITENVYWITNKPGVNDQYHLYLDADVVHELTPLCLIVPFQYLVAKVTKEKNNFKCHPLFAEFEKVVRCKTDDYEEIMKNKAKM